MEQLQPILKHRFWIIFGLALLLPLVGWFLSSGQAKSYIDERTTKLSGINVQSGANAPNDDWSQKLAKINEREKQLLETAAAELWQNQKRLMIWPPALRYHLRNVAYRDTVPLPARSLYVSAYLQELERVRLIAKPYDLQTGKGFVRIPPGSVLQMDPNHKKWQGSGSAISAQMWDAQEDIWLQDSLMRAVARLNEQAEPADIGDAHIRQVLRVILRGGTRATGDGQTQSDMTDMMGSEMDELYQSEEEYGGETEEYDMEGGGMGGRTAANVSFDLGEEFGSAGLGMGYMGEMEGDMTNSNSMTLNAEAAGATGASTGPREKRYVDDDPELPFRTRAFYIEVVMDHTKLPEFIGELISLPWPVEIVRIQQGTFTGGATGGGAPSMGYSGTMSGPSSNPFLTSRGSFGSAGIAPRGPSAFGGSMSLNTAPGGFGGQRGFGPRRTGPSPAASTVDARQMRENAERMQKAFDDPNLSKVAIAGLMTLFNAPEGTPGAGVSSNGTTLAADLTVDPSASVSPGEVTGDPALATDGAAPSDGQPTAENPMPPVVGEEPEPPATEPAESPPPAGEPAPTVGDAPVLPEATNN